jgi:hypothetical protein
VLVLVLVLPASEKAHPGRAADPGSLFPLMPTGLTGDDQRPRTSTSTITSTIGG